MDISNVKHDEMYGYYIVKKLTSMSETTRKNSKLSLAAKKLGTAYKITREDKRY